MDKYIATFHTHFGVMSFHNRLKDLGDTTARMVACPRELSVSCGTALTFDYPFSEDLVDEDTEAVYEVTDDGYVAVWHEEA